MYFTANKIRYFSLLTLIAFMMNVMLPFFAVYGFEQGLARQSSSGEKILICTEDGFRWVSWESLQDSGESPKPHKKYRCALCYIAANGLKYFTPLHDVAASYDCNVEYISYSVINIALPQSASPRRLQPRAPPFPA